MDCLWRCCLVRPLLSSVARSFSLLKTSLSSPSDSSSSASSSSFSFVSCRAFLRLSGLFPFFSFLSNGSSPACFLNAEDTTAPSDPRRRRRDVFFNEKKKRQVRFLLLHLAVPSLLLTAVALNANYRRASLEHTGILYERELPSDDARR